MYAIDILLNSKKYETKQQIFENFEQIALFLRNDIIKMKQKNNSIFFVDNYFDDYYSDSIRKNYAKLQKMKNALTAEFWDKKTTKQRAFQIIQSMLSSELSNEMDASRGGKPLVNEMQLYHATQFEDMKSGNDSALNNAEIEMDLEKFDKKILKNGLKKMAEDLIFEKDPQDLLEQIKYLCKKYGFKYEEIVPDSKAEFNKMIQAGEIKIDECNQMFFDF